MSLKETFEQMNDPDKLHLTVNEVITESEFSYNKEQQDIILNSYKVKEKNYILDKILPNLSGEARDAQLKQLTSYIGKLARGAERVYLELSEEQRKFVRLHANEMTDRQIACKIFNNEFLKPLSKEVRVVSMYIKAMGFRKPKLSEFGVGDEDDQVVTQVPSSSNGKAFGTSKDLRNLAIKVNSILTGDDVFDPDNLRPIDKKNLLLLQKRLNNPLYKATKKNIDHEEYKEIFENEFISGTFGKDLTYEDVNMYITLSSEYVNSIEIKRVLKSLNEDMEAKALDEDSSLKMAAVTAYAEKQKEWQHCQNQIQKLQKSLSTSYAERTKNNRAANASISQFIELWKTEKERRRMIIIAEAEKQKVKDWIDQVESSEDYIAKVMGISREEILNG